MSNPLSKIPQLEKLLSHSLLSESIVKIGRPVVSEIASAYLDDVRNAFKKNIDAFEPPTILECAEAVQKKCEKTVRKRITNVINATGIVLHTNMGRSPLPEHVWESAGKAASGYSTIEMSLADGKRGKRFEFLTKCMSLITGAEESLMVNNNAAAVFLMLKAHAENREVIVARGQQVQIGGGFRIPEILKAAGCKLVEVGTTNITTTDDILNAITENTAMVLWVHTSNYRIRGFTKEPAVREIKSVLPEDIILAVDQGSGNINLNIPDEPTVSSLVKEGADMVCFSGDKILGGPQAGWIVGKGEYITKIAKHQLMRTYRVGRAVASLMEACLVHYLNNGESVAGKALHCNLDKIKNRCENIVNALPENKASVEKHSFSLGGGSTPDTSFPSWAVKLNTHKLADKIKTDLRNLTPPIIAVVEDSAVFLNLTTVDEKDDAYLKVSINEVLK
ncbi:MAG: L-seryl-tRNA(Sec) selenium transferase [Treponema sp.]|nr:MAG: L-seryl-tRNA(Sec) selenium transferase [Treponema sp.]